MPPTSPQRFVAVLLLAAAVGCVESEIPCDELAALAATCFEDRASSLCEELASEESRLLECASEDDAASPDAFSELEDSSAKTMRLVNRIDAPLETVWDFYRSMHPGKLFGSSVTIDSYRCAPPHQDIVVEIEEGFPVFETGMEFRATLHELISLRLDMATTNVDLERREVEITYLERAPASGRQWFRFDEAVSEDGFPATEVVHVAEYRGKNIFYDALYPMAHSKAFEPYHLAAKSFLERSSLLELACSNELAHRDFVVSLEWFEQLKVSLQSDVKLSDLDDDDLFEGLCQFQSYPSHRLAPFPKTDEDFATMVGELAWSMRSGAFEAPLETVANACSP